jgi:hypothetical protein
MACYYLHSMKLQKRRGLIEEDNTLDECLNEASWNEGSSKMLMAYNNIGIL